MIGLPECRASLFFCYLINISWKDISATIIWTISSLFLECIAISVFYVSYFWLCQSDEKKAVLASTIFLLVQMLRFVQCGHDLAIVLFMLHLSFTCALVIYENGRIIPHKKYINEKWSVFSFSFPHFLLVC